MLWPLRAHAHAHPQRQTEQRGTNKDTESAVVALTDRSAAGSSSVPRVQSRCSRLAVEDASHLQAEEAGPQAAQCPTKEEAGGKKGE